MHACAYVCAHVQFMAKSLRSKRKQKIKAIRRAKYGEIERKKCWEKHEALQTEKSEDMITEGNVILIIALLPH